jgi:L-cysteine/cystine lyase
MTIDWRAIRAEYPVTERCIYLNTGWSGPQSRSVVRALEQRAEREAFDGPTTIDVRHEKALLVQAARRAFASMIGADDDEVALGYTTTEGVNTVLRGLGLGSGDEVITCNLEHNSVMVPSYMSRLRDGVELKILRFSSGETAWQMVQIFEQAITPRTKLLVLSHISFNRGTLLPIREICEIAHRRSALVAVDAAQSVGQIAVDVKELDCDFMALPGHKWLLAPDGAAALFVKREHIERLQPLAVVHGANREYDYEGHFEHASDTIHKFELTTHSGPVLAGLVEAVSELQRIGIAAVEARTRELADRFVAGAQRIEGVRLTSPLDPSVRTAIVTFVIGDHNPSETCAALWSCAKIVGRVCNDKRVRVCFHIFNDESDVDRTLEVIEQMSGHGLPAGTPTEAEYKAQVLEADD